MLMLMSVFLVEDRADIRDSLVEGMEELAPLRFVGQVDGEAAATQWFDANHGNWDLAIVDLFLAEGSGFGVLKVCRARQPWQKVVVFTSHSQKNILDHCRDLGADEVFHKSADVDKLVDYCRNHAQDLASIPRTMQ
jgi:DNA-binding NarL/FixJ family response regulator